MRRKDEQGRVIAEIEDYQVVRELVADLVAVGVEATVKPEVREVVDMVRRLLDEGREDVRHVDSGAKRNRFKRSGFERFCQAL